MQRRFTPCPGATWATLAGFANHRELGLQGAGRMLATRVPFTTSWLAIATLLGLFRREATAAGEDLSTILPQVRQRLEQCPDCLEEFDCLVTMLKSDQG